MTPGGPEGEGAPYKVEGIGQDKIPGTLDLDVVDEWRSVDDRTSFAMARRLTREEGLFVGGSSGLITHVALEIAREVDDPDACVVTMLCDTGERYLSKLYNDEWLREHQLLEPARVTAALMIGMKRPDVPRAIVSVDVPCSPVAPKRTIAAWRTSSRRSSAVWRGPGREVAAGMARMLVSTHNPCQVDSSDEPQRRDRCVHGCPTWYPTCMDKTSVYLGAEERRMLQRLADLEQVSRNLASRLASGPAEALSWTKHTLNHWLRLAYPIFDASLAYEFLGFSTGDAAEGLAAVKEKRSPKFG